MSMISFCISIVELRIFNFSHSGTKRVLLGIIDFTVSMRVCVMRSNIFVCLSHLEFYGCVNVFGSLCRSDR